jgi:glycosyltransferase involved in cell wall biosynthesis
MLTHEEEPLVTIVIPVYNGARWITRTLASAVAQTYPNIEIVVVDDGSTDHTAAIVESAASQDRRIRLLRKDHSGLPATRNFGISHANGTLIAPLDADDLWHSEKLTLQVAKMQASPKVGLVYCWAVEIDENDLIMPPVRNGNTAQGRVIAEVASKAGIVDSGSNPLIRRSYFDVVGGYDPYQTLGAEDWKLCLALAQICEFAVVPAHLVGYRRLDKSMSRKVAKMDQAMEMVVRWLRKQWRDMPPELARQMDYHKNTYLAHLALTTNDFASAIRYKARSYKIRPATLLTPSSLTFCVRLLVRMAGLKRFKWPGRRVPISFKDLRIGLEAESNSIP